LARVLPIEQAAAIKVNDRAQLASTDAYASRRLFLYFIRNKGEATVPFSIKEKITWHAK
jgi:hypothetical protein